MILTESLVRNSYSMCSTKMERLRRKKYLIKCLSGDGGPGGKGKRSGSKGAGKGKGKKGKRSDGKLGVCAPFQHGRCKKSAENCKFAHVLYANDQQQ